MVARYEWREGLSLSQSYAVSHAQALSACLIPGFTPSDTGLGYFCLFLLCCLSTFHWDNSLNYFQLVVSLLTHTAFQMATVYEACYEFIGCSALISSRERLWVVFGHYLVLWADCRRQWSPFLLGLTDTRTAILADQPQPSRIFPDYPDVSSHTIQSLATACSAEPSFCAELSAVR